jgi:hypothetical protein
MVHSFKAPVGHCTCHMPRCIWKMQLHGQHARPQQLEGVPESGTRKLKRPSFTEYVSCFLVFLAPNMSSYLVSCALCLAQRLHKSDGLAINKSERSSFSSWTIGGPVLDGTEFVKLTEHVHSLYSRRNAL